MKFIIGKKIEMTQIWQDDQVVAVTKVAAGPCTVTQVKTNDKDGYESIQLGYGERKEKNIKKPQKGHLKNLGNLRYLKEFRSETGEIKRGDKIEVGTFEVGDIINVTATSKGKGFQGVVKRHGFKGSKMTHGNKDQLRMPGSIGATGPAHVFKGMRMPGRMGADQVTTKNLEIIKVDTENNILYIKGSVPGARNGLVVISGNGELKLSKTEKVEKEIKEEKIEENIEKVVEEAAKDKPEVIEEGKKSDEAVKEEDSKEKK